MPTKKRSVIPAAARRIAKRISAEPAKALVSNEIERQNKEAVKGVRKTAKRAGEIAEHTSAYDAQRKSAGRKRR
jgi:hypothetical protein